MKTVNAARLGGLLRERGADLVGFADLSGLSYGGLDRGISVAARLPVHTVRGIEDGPTRDYFNQYHALNARLDALAEFAAAFLREAGCRAAAQTTTAVVESEDGRTAVPHKTVATRAGLGWIGKSALLVTPEFGPAVRLTSVLTDAMFDQVGTPVTESRCGNCLQCATHCPGRAIQGNLWRAGLEREALVDAGACWKAARALAWERVGERITLCGKCIEVCPYTRAYLKREGSLEAL